MLIAFLTLLEWVGLIAFAAGVLIFTTIMILATHDEIIAGLTTTTKEEDS